MDEITNPIQGAQGTNTAPTTTNTGSNWASSFNWGSLGTGIGSILSGTGNLIAGTKGTNNVPITNNIAPPPPTANNNTILYVAVAIVGVEVLGITIYFITRKKSS